MTITSKSLYQNFGVINMNSFLPFNYIMGHLLHQFKHFKIIFIVTTLVLIGLPLVYVGWKEN